MGTRFRRMLPDQAPFDEVKHHRPLVKKRGRALYLCVACVLGHPRQVGARFRHMLPDQGAVEEVMYLIDMINIALCLSFGSCGVCLSLYSMNFFVSDSCDFVLPVFALFRPCRVPIVKLFSRSSPLLVDPPVPCSLTLSLPRLVKRLPSDTRSSFNGLGISRLSDCFSCYPS